MNHSDASEQALLGNLMLDNSQYDIVSIYLKPEDFYVPIHAAIYRTIGDVIKNGKQAWGPTLLEVLKDTPFCDPGYLGQVMSYALESKSAPKNAQHILELAYLRRMDALCAEMTKKKDLVSRSELQKQIAELSLSHAKNTEISALPQLQCAFKSANEPLRMIKTGYSAWDGSFGGLMRGARYIIAGQSGAGKTALAVNIAWNVANQGKKVRYVFFEGTEDELWWRIMARVASIPITSLREGLNPSQSEKLVGFTDELKDRDFAVVRNPRDISQMISMCGACDVIVLDGMSSAPATGDTLIERLANVSSYSKTLADRTGAAVIMLSHLNSSGVKNGGDGTAVYGGQAPTFDPEGILELKQEKTQGSVKMVTGNISKNRYGPTDSVKFIFDGKYMTYKDA